MGNPHRAQISQFELFELILSLKLDKQLAVEQFEATASQSAVITPPLVQVEGSWSAESGLVVAVTESTQVAPRLSCWLN